MLYLQTLLIQTLSSSSNPQEMPLALEAQGLEVLLVDTDCLKRM